MSRTNLVEQGDIFLSYRPRVETAKVADRPDVQRFFVLLAVGHGDGAGSTTSGAGSCARSTAGIGLPPP